jgi:hypothetical protein
MVLYSPLRGIVQISNSTAPIVAFRLFASGIGFSLTINYIFLISFAYAPSIKGWLSQFNRSFHTSPFPHRLQIIFD